jgi:hypothetical protein
VALAAEGEGALDLLTVDRLGEVGLVLLDHREEVAEQGALIRGELAGDGVRAGRPGPVRRLPDAGVTVPRLVSQPDAAGEPGGPRGARYVGCALLRRNSMASWCLATQST